MTSGPLAASTGTTFGNYGYDSRNRLTSAGGSGYRYNPDGLRVAISGTGAATFVIDPNAALSRMLLRTKGGTTTYYVYGYGLLYEETGANTKTYHTNQVGSTLAITDSTQSVTDWIEYAPFGTITYRSGSTDTPFLFNGEAGVQTEANGLYYMRARFYHARLMRFVNADPIGFSGGLNWYIFAGGDPVISSDPLGLKDSRNNDGQVTGELYGTLILEKIVIGRPEVHLSIGIGGTLGMMLGPSPGPFGHVETNVGVAINLRDFGESRFFVNYQKAAMIGIGIAAGGGLQKGIALNWGEATKEGRSVATTLHVESSLPLRKGAIAGVSVDLNKDGASGAKELRGLGLALYGGVGVASTTTYASKTFNEMISEVDRIVRYGFD